MSQEPPSPEEEASREAGEPRSASFVQRLRDRFGDRVDPRISLQEESLEGEVPEAPEAPEGQRDPSGESSGSRGFFKRLTQDPPSGSRFRVLKEIARGGMGTILRIWDDDLRRNLAMKVLHGGRALEDEEEVDEERLSRFLEEAQITGQLDHPGIVPVHSVGIDENGRCYFTMRLVRGRELKEVLDLAREGKEGWTITRTLALILKVCEAMAFAHSKGVVHRDLKPANVMVGRFGEVYVMDWGLARVLGRADKHDLRLKRAEDPSALSLVRTVRKDESMTNPDSPLVTMDGDVVGTPSYMAPEQAQGKLEEVGPRSDVYSLGAILYYMLTGRAPYVKPGEKISPHTVLSRVLEGPPVPVRKLARDVPGELVAICEKAMARDPDTRYSGMLSVAGEIQAFLENRVVKAYEGGATAEFRKWVARNRGMAAATAGLVAMSIASALGFGWQKSKQVDALNRQQVATLEAKFEADEQRQRAEESAEEARTNLELALARKEEADQNAKIARDNAALAQGSSYMANLIAASFSLQLKDVGEARRLLEETDSTLRDLEWAHLRLRAHPELATFRPQELLDDLALDAHGERLFFVSRTGKLVVLDSRTGEVLPPENIINISLSARLMGSDFERNLAVDAGGRLAALAGLDEAVRIYDLETSERASLLPPDETVQGHAEVVTALAFRPDGQVIASASEDGAVIVWELRSESVLQRLTGHSGEVSRIAWNPDGTRLATASVDETVHIWDARSGEVLHVLRGHQGRVLDLSWDSRGELLASAGADQAIHLWEAESGALSGSLFGHEGPVMAVDFDPDGGKLCSAGSDASLRIWDLETGRSRILLGHEADEGQQFVSARYLAGGKRIVSLGVDYLVGEIKIWDADFDASVTELPFHERMVNAVDFHPTRQETLTASDDGTVGIWNADSAELLRLLRGHEGTVHAAAYSPDGETILTGGGDKTARLWDARTGRELRRLEGHQKWVGVVAFAPDGSFLLSGSGDGELRVWDAGTGELRRTLPENPRWMRALAVSPDGRLAATGGAGHEIVVRDILGEKEPVVLPGHELRGIKALLFTHDGERLISGGSMDHVVRVWDLATRECVQVLRGHDQMVTALAINPAGTRLASGSMDRTVRIWDLVWGGSLLVLEGHASEVTSLDFSPDGSRLASSSRDTTARIWETGRVAERRQAVADAREQRQLAEPIVADLFARSFFVEDVVLAVRADADLTPELRETCVRLAELRGDDPALLDELNREIVLSPDREAAAYDLAARRALAALSLKRDDPRLQITLGAAQLRRGDPRAAIDSISGALDDVRRLSDGPAELLALALLALSHKGVGDRDAALTFLDEARALAQRAQPAQSPEILAVLREAEGAVGTTEGS